MQRYLRALMSKVFAALSLPGKRRHAGVSQNDALSCEVPYSIVESHSMLSVRKYENDE